MDVKNGIMKLELISKDFANVADVAASSDVAVH